MKKHFVVQIPLYLLIRIYCGDPGPSAIKDCNQSENLHGDGQNSLDAEVSVSAASKEIIVSSDEKQSLHGVLQREVKTLCETLKLPVQNSNS